MPAGIDRISFYTTRYSLDLKLLAEARDVAYEKFTVGLGQAVMGVPPPDEDSVTMAAAAAKPILDEVGVDAIELLFFATESGVDQSKAAGMFLHGLLGLPARCRVVELKQACYAGTIALRMAALMVAASGRKALVVTSDIARYDLGSPGEPTQGCGAVAMLVSAEPAILALDPEAGIHAEDVMDFWRPNYREEAVVDGKYSTRIYLATLRQAWRQYAARTGRTPADLARCCYHIPFTNMAVKAHDRLLKEAGITEGRPALIEAAVRESLGYNRQTGNTYTASLYEGLTCLLDTATEALDGQRIGFFSYGSGAVGEFFSGTVVPGYRDHLFTEKHRELIETRTRLTVQEYEDIFNLCMPTDGWEYSFSQYRTGPFRLSGVNAHRRLYEAV
ncbi:MAG: hydroxymethylglutaryl-CoA synthase [Verrucomicrobia bacterium]|nr:hydroxymethylglutaryl-CoA synthase [Verrucomicrobiota bacterium]MBT7066593.1 hydroxymethylglutaryl-CoA synthase [Verrucomicrobiota bacterium]MBT7701523.1 hydroxymethylglutaryl-CoA synthase [Verrucomicrobiota bacterium]